MAHSWSSNASAPRCHHQGISYNLICISRMLLKVFINSDKAHVEEALHRLGLQGLLCSQITRTWQFGVQSLSMGNRMDCISKIKTLGLFLSRNTSKLISTGKKLKIVSAMTSIQFKHGAINEQLQCINCLKSRAFENMVRSVSTGLHYLIYGGGGRLLDARPAAPGSPLPLLVLCEFYCWVRFMNDRCQELLRRGN